MDFKHLVDILENSKLITMSSPLTVFPPCHLGVSLLVNTYQPHTSFSIVTSPPIVIFTIVLLLPWHCTLITLPLFSCHGSIPCLHARTHLSLPSPCHCFLVASASLSLPPSSPHHGSIPQSHTCCSDRVLVCNTNVLYSVINTRGPGWACIILSEPARQCLIGIA